MMRMECVGVALLWTLAGCGETGTAPDPTDNDAALATAALPVLNTGEMEPLVREMLDRRRNRILTVPKEARAWSDLGFALDAHLMLEEAEVCLAQALKLNATHFESAYDHAFLGTLLPRDAQEVSERFARAAKLKPDYAPVFARHGDHLLANGDAAAAAAEFQRALDVFAGYDYARLGLARAWLEADDEASIERATSALGGLFQRFTGDPAVATAFGQALTLRGNGALATEVSAQHASIVNTPGAVRVPIMDSLRREIIELSRTAASNFQRGQAKLRANDLEGAAVELERVLSADAENATARALLAKTLIGLRRMTAARAQLDLLLEQNKNSAEAHALLGQLDTEMGQFEAALAHFDQVAARATPDDITYRAWVTALGSLEQWEAALYRLDRWESESPTCTDPAYLRALALANVDRDGDARAELSRAITADPKNALRAQVEPKLAR